MLQPTDPARRALLRSTWDNALPHNRGTVKDKPLRGGYAILHRTPNMR